MRALTTLRFAGMIGLPLLTLTAYLHWRLPEPLRGPAWLELLPYVACLALGMPFAVSLARRTGHTAMWVAIYLILGTWVIGFYAIGYLCAARGMCL